MTKFLLSIFALFSVLCIITATHIATPRPVVAKATPPSPQREHRDLNLNLIKRIYCEDPHTGFRGIGTGWVIRENTVVTAAHVVQGRCSDADRGVPAVLTHIDLENDFAIVEMQTGAFDRYVTFNCDGFRIGQRYTAMGWRSGTIFMQTSLRALRWRTGNEITIDDHRAVNLRILSGNIYHGMSGGPIFDEYNEAVGINSATDEMNTGFSRDLRDTILCGEPRRNPPLPTQN